MIVDTSALMAIIKNEDEAEILIGKLGKAKSPAAISAASYLETGIVADGFLKGRDRERVDDLCAEFALSIVAVTADHARIARQAYRDYGKGTGHPARLNFGDCFAYALAKSEGEPLLFKGEDFALTDIEAA